MKSVYWVWDYNIGEETFIDILNHKKHINNLDYLWATQRLLEYASYQDVVKFLGFDKFVKRWPLVRNKIRSKSQKRGYDFLLKWLTEIHPEKFYG